MSKLLLACGASLKCTADLFWKRSFAQLVLDKGNALQLIFVQRRLALPFIERDYRSGWCGRARDARA